MKKNILTFVIGFTILCSCKQEEKVGSFFTRNSFKEHIELSNPLPIQVEDTYNDPASFYLIQDSLVLVNNQLHSDYLIEIYSLNTKKPVLQLAQKGQGPGNFLSCLSYSTSSQDPQFYAQDTEKHIFYTIDIEHTLKEKKLCITDQFPYDTHIHPYTRLCPLEDGKYLGYNMWYLESRDYNNKVPEFSIHNKVINEQDSSPNTSEEPQYDYFVADVNGGNLINTGKNIWLADMHKAQITLYDYSLNTIKVLNGPDDYEIEYESRVTNIPTPFVLFRNEKNYSSYKNWTLTNKHLYIIYENLIDGSFDPEHLKPVEIFKFDLDGNPLSHYKLDKYVYHISVDKDEKYLYATARSSYKEPAEFVRYSLEGEVSGKTN